MEEPHERDSKKVLLRAKSQVNSQVNVFCIVKRMVGEVCRGSPLSRAFRKKMYALLRTWRKETEDLILRTLRMILNGFDDF